MSGRNGPGTLAPRPSDPGDAAAHNLEAEESVVGALLLAGTHGVETARATRAHVHEASLEAKHFYRTGLGLIFVVCDELLDREEPCDPPMVRDELERRGQLEEIGGLVRLRELAHLMPSTRNAGHHAQLVREAASRRQEQAAGQELVRAAENGGLPARPELRERLAALVDDARPDRGARFRLDVQTARGLCELPDHSQEDRLLGPGIVRRYRTVVGGGTGHGKTELIFQMLRAVTTGGEFLGWRASGRHRALVLDLEQGLGSVQRKLRRAGLAESEQIEYVRVPDGLALNREPAQIAAVEAVLERGYDVVVLDPHYKAHQGDANSERETVDLMRLLDAWREHYGFALILPTHTRKPPEAGAKLTIHDLFGSSAFVRGAELVLGVQLVRPGYSRLHFFKDRDGVDELPVGGDAWGLLFDHEHGFRRDPNETAPPRDLEEELRELGVDGAWRTLKEWKAPKDDGGIGANEREIAAALGRLLEGGEFEYAVGPKPRQSTAKCWRRRGATSTPWHPVAPVAPGAVSEMGATLPLPPEGGTAAVVAPVDRLPREARGTLEPEQLAAEGLEWR